MNRSQHAQDDALYAWFPPVIFLVRTTLIGFVFLREPFFIVSESETFRIFAAFLCVTNVLQLVFMISVLQTKNLFQFLLYIPLVLYSIFVASTLLAFSTNLSGKVGDEIFSYGNILLIVYLVVEAVEIVMALFMYRQLRTDFLWANFKKFGANSAINSKCNIFNFRCNQDQGRIECSEETSPGILVHTAVPV